MAVWRRLLDLTLVSLLGQTRPGVNGFAWWRSPQGTASTSPVITPRACTRGLRRPQARHLEHFADHARVDRLRFDGVLDPDGGRLTPDTARTGFGLELADRAQRFEEPGHGR